MSKKVDLELINKKQQLRETAVQEGRFIETLESEGRSPEGLKVAAKEILGIGEDDIIQLEFTDKMNKQNNQTKAFVALTNFATKAAEANMLTEEETQAVSNIEARLAVIVAERFGIDLEDLYTEGGI